jgi:UDPglucose 6-dehydrogenase
MDNTGNYFGILGYGYVGRGTHHGILKNQNISIHDKILGTSRSNLKESSVVFVCIPTSTSNDIDILIQEVRALVSQNSNVQIVIRSTLPVGTCNQIETQLGIKIIYIPEFLRERFWEEDCQRRPLIVGHSGIEIPDWLANDSTSCCTLAEAEMVKMFSNNFAVARIAFANLFYDLAQQAGAEYDRVKDMYFQVAHDQTYMEVPGHDGTRGFGGKCLPKDLDFLIDSLDKENLNSDWFKNIRSLNKKWQEKF